MKFNFLNQEVASIHSAALLLGAAGLLSRVLGIFRDRLLAANFGAGKELDIYYAAFQIPDFMSVIFLLGAGSAAILPIFQEYLAKDRKEAERFISEMTSFFIFGATPLLIIIFVLIPFIAALIVPGFSPVERSLTVWLTRFMLLSPLLFGLSSIFSSVVQSFGRFLSYALAPILYNIGIIIGIVFFAPRFGIMGLGGGVVLGAMLHVGIQFWTVRQLGFNPFKFVSLRDKLKFRFNRSVLKVFQLSFPRVISLSLSQLTVVILMALASTLAAGSISIFQLAQNLYFLPIGVFGISYSIAIFPQLSRYVIGGDAKGFFDKLFLGIRSVLFWIAPISILFIVMRAHIVRLSLGAGLFSWEDTRLTAAMLAVFAIAMFAGSLSAILIKGFYALENTWAPLAINIGSIVISVALAFLFTKILSRDPGFVLFVGRLFRVGDLSDIRVLGVALGFSVGLVVNITLLYFALRRLASKTFNYCQPFPAGELLKIIIASFLAGAAAYFVRLSFTEVLPLVTFLRVLAQGALATLIGFLVYFGALFVTKNEDAKLVLQSLQKRLFRTKLLPQSWDNDHGVK